ncbi:MAG: type 1 glutamine amidotransferase domain-containing protein [Flavobacteriales bacterium]|nr:type 1 glutamine amidotransferase domain-containing protein [Flavobacteriales bacterium]
MKKTNILFVTTSHDELGTSGTKTGVWFEEVANPYYIFKQAGFDITIASVKGGKIPIDPASELPEWQTKDTLKFAKDKEAMAFLNNSLNFSKLDNNDYDMVYFPGGHGPMWDFIDNPKLTQFLEAFISQSKPIGALCHGVAILVDAINDKGFPYIKGKKITSYSNTEEVAVGAQNIVPFLLETKLKELGSMYSKGNYFAPYVVVDDNLVTGQNPASASEVAKEMILVLTNNAPQQNV